MGTRARQRTEEKWKLEELLAREFGIPREEITCESRFDDDLGADWFDRLELLDSLEITFDIRISDDGMKQLDGGGAGNPVAPIGSRPLESGARHAPHMETVILAACDPFVDERRAPPSSPAKP